MQINSIRINYLIISSFLLLILCCQSSQVSMGKLTILSHPKQEKINKTIIISPLAYQQHLPNLEMLKIRIVKADPFDACLPISTSKIYPLQDNSAYLDTFLVVDGKSGNCKYWRKVEMAKEAMVKGLIIIDDDHERNSNQAYDYNNGQFYSFLVKPEDADNLVSIQNKDIEAKLTIFETQAPKQRKKLTLWLSSLNQQSYDYIRWWNETLTNIPQIQDKVTWQPKYVFYGQHNNQSKHVYSCACSGLFCSPQYHGKTTDVLVKQDLRQKLIFQQYPTQYLLYMTNFIQRCLSSYLKDMFIEQCAKTQMINTKINETRINKQIEKFLLDCDKDTEIFSKLLTDKGRFSMIGTYPVILLNREILQFTSQNELQAVLCRKFSLEQSQGCIQYYHTTIKEIIVSIVFFLLILGGLFGVGFFIVMCYKNRLRKQMHKQVKMQVSTAVEHYFQLSQDMSNRK